MLQMEIFVYMQPVWQSVLFSFKSVFLSLYPRNRIIFNHLKIRFRAIISYSRVASFLDFDFVQMEKQPGLGLA